MGRWDFGGWRQKRTGAQSLVGNPFGFGGQRYDPETGLYMFRNRAYSPKLGRFLQRDPAGYEVRS